LPGRKTKAGIRQELSLDNVPDHLANANSIVGHMRYGGAIGNGDQHQICATSA